MQVETARERDQDELTELLAQSPAVAVPSALFQRETGGYVLHFAQLTYGGAFTADTLGWFYKHDGTVHGPFSARQISGFRAPLPADMTALWDAQIVHLGERGNGGDQGLCAPRTLRLRGAD